MLSNPDPGKDRKMRVQFNTNHFAPLTSDIVAEVESELRKALAEAQKAVALCEHAADLLAPYAHHKRVNRGTAKRLMDADPDLWATVYPRWNSRQFRVAYTSNGANGYRPRLDVDIDAPDDMTVAQLIDALRACEMHRQEVARVQAHLDNLPALVAAEERMRELAHAFERERDAAADLIHPGRGPYSPVYWHEAIRDHFLALCAGG